MNHKILDITIALMAASLVFTACKKDDDEPAVPTAPNNPAVEDTNTPPAFPDAAGVLWAVKAISTQEMPGMPFPMEVEMGVGTAIFPDANGSFQNAGAVNLNGKQLDRAANNVYYFTPSMTEPMGIDFDNGVHWSIAGSDAVPSADFSPTFPFPSVNEITSSTTINRSQGYTLTATGVNQADSVIFQVGSVVKTKAGGTQSCSFSADELGSLASGPSIIQVAAYKYQVQAVAGSDFYLGKQVAKSKSATLQ